MAYIKQRHEYLFENIQTSKLDDVYKIVNNQLAKTFGPIGTFPPEIEVNKENGEKLRGKLFIIIDGNHGIRFNWKSGDKYSFIVSVDLWKKVTYLNGLNNPDKTIDLGGSSVVNALNMIEKYFNNNISELHDPNMRDAPKEKSEVISIMDLDEKEFENISLDLFELLKYKIYQIANKYSKTYSLIITGISGVGKSYDSAQALKEMRADYKSITGSVTTAGLYDLLYRYHDQLILIDDADSVFKSENSVNMLKGALDSSEVRVVSNEVATNFQTDGMTMNDIIANTSGDISKAENPNLFKAKNKGRMPKNFYFTGKIIFISNLDGEDFNSALITRASAHIDIQMTHNEILDRMKLVMKRMHPNVDYDKKIEVLNLIDFLTSTYETRYPLSIRFLYNAIDTMNSNQMLTTINGKKLPMWQIMIKQDMLPPIPIKRDSKTKK